MAFGDARCTSCGLALGGRGSAQFRCPSCADADLGRCSRCRDQSVVYVCPNCAFEGP